MNETVISIIQALPTSPFENTGFAGIVITSGVPSYFKIMGLNLDNIVSVNWYPRKSGSVLFEIRQLVLVNSSVGTFLVKVLDNYLNTDDRAGYLKFKLKDGTDIPYPVRTYGPVAAMPMWRSPEQGLITG